MAGTNNFLVWNPDKNNQQSDVAWVADTQRLNGAENPSLFASTRANKLFYQLTTMVYSLAQMMANKGYNVSEAIPADLIDVLANLITVDETYELFTDVMTGSANAYSITINTPVGVPFLARVNVTNSGSCTLATGLVGATPIYKRGATALVALVAQDLVAGVYYSFVYDGTYFIVGDSISSRAASVVASNLSIHEARLWAHSATATPTANRMVAYDSGGRLGTNAPVNDNNCSRKLDLDTHAALTSAHSATATPTANRMVAYDSVGALVTNAPVNDNNCSRKLDLDTHSALTSAHSATAAPTANRMAAYDSVGALVTNAPVNDNNCSRKLDLDTHAALTSAHSATATPTANRMAAYDASGRLSTNAPSGSDDCVQFGQFGRLLGANGYQQLPGGLIIQWGTVSIPSSNITITLPIAFPTAGCSIVASLSSAPSTYGLTPQAYFVGNSQAFFDLYGSNVATAYYIAIGY